MKTLSSAVIVALLASGCGDDGQANRDETPRDAGEGSTVDADDSAQRDDANNRDAQDDLGRDADPQLDFTRLVPSCFAGGQTPQLDLSGPVANWTWNDPHVLRVGDEYWMYASATDSFTFPVRIYRLVSNDGATWALDPAEPVLDVGESGSFDAGGVETPGVVFWRGRYHLFDTAYAHAIDDPEHSVLEFRVGYAVSDDGVTFTRPTTEPIVAPSATDADSSNDWYSVLVGEPGPVVRDDVLYVYFTAVGGSATLGTSLQVVGVTSTTDGVEWSDPQIALEPDQALYPRGDDWIGYSTPNAVVLGDETHLFFDVAHQPEGGEWLQLRLHHARSSDGIDGWVHDEAAILGAGDLPWAMNEVRSPHALLDGTTLRLYFAGHALDGAPPEHFGIGMLRCNLAP